MKESDNVAGEAESDNAAGDEQAATRLMQLMDKKCDAATCFQKITLGTHAWAMPSHANKSLRMGVLETDEAVDEARHDRKWAWA